MLRFVFVVTMLVTTSAHAGDSVDMALLIPEQWKQTIFTTTCQQLQDCCGWHRYCGTWWQGVTTQPAPVPLPSAGLLLIATLASLFWRMR